MSETLLKIGQVHSVLRKEHPDLELSKIRYYEDMGLVVPTRTKKGYRLYSERDIACLREAIRLADEEFLPLRVIRLRLIDKGLLDGEPVAKPVTKRAARVAQLHAVSMPVPTTEDATIAPVVPRTTDASRPALQIVPVPAVEQIALDTIPATMGMTEFVQRSGVDPAIINRLIAAGILVAGQRGTEQLLTSGDIAVAQACATLVKNGADVRLLASMRRVVEREVGILHDITATTRATAGSADEARSAVLDAHAELAMLRHAMLQRDVTDFFKF